MRGNAAAGACAFLLAACATRPSFALREDREEGSLAVLLHGRELFRYQHGERWALPHLHPLRGPSGRSLTVQRAQPFPHHRAVWIADHVTLLPDGPSVDFYHEWKNLEDPAHPERGHRRRIRHVRLREARCEGDRALVEAELLWMAAPDRPVLAETRRFVVHDLGGGDYRVDLSWELRAAFGDVRFESDRVHYAWPYVRVHETYSVQQGGVLEDSEGRRGQRATNGRRARWVDDSAEVAGVTEGVAVFAPPDAPPPRWLTRDYGCFGPRRPDAFDGTRFVLRRGEVLRGAAALLVHRGDARTGRVAARYEDYAARRRLAAAAERRRRRGTHGPTGSGEIPGPSARPPPDPTPARPNP